VAAYPDVALEELHRYSLAEYHRLMEAGAFEDAHVELLEGLLVDVSPKTPRHEQAVRRLARWLIRGIDDTRFEVGIASPLTLASGSEPEPDVAVFERAAPQPYHPASAALVIEVALSSLARDLTVKPAIYATAGVSEYWVVDLEAARVVVHRTPVEHRYAERFDVTAPDATLTPSAVGVEPLALREIFGPDA
jgi:Uma2 family endonuclease